ncbi:MFS transporter [Clostridium malenominatum]|uniref:MFS transporter n=1 Tax=Clostridium malenominatum TaxID=1539 RepID=A0ABN1IZT0_9CLOT
MVNKNHFSRLASIYKLMVGNLISFIGDQIYIIAIPWIVYNITGSITQMATITAIGKIPNMFQPISGVWVDRFNKKKLLLVCDALESILVCSMGFFYLWEKLELPYIYLITIISGFLSQIYNSAKFSVIPLLAKEDDLHYVNSLDSGIYNMGILIGPSIGGLIISAFNPGYALIINGVSFLGTLVAVLFTEISEESIDKKARHLKYLKEDLKMGFNFVFKTPSLLYTNTALIFSSLGTTLFLTVMFFYLRSIVGLNASEVGVLLSIGGVGAILGSLLTNHLIKYISHIKIIILGMLLGGSSIVIFGIARSYMMLVLSNALGTFAVSLINPCVTTIRQSVTPKYLLGRVQATSRFITWILIPIAAYAAGVMSDFWGSSTTIVIGGIIQMTSSLILFKIVDLEIFKGDSSCEL